MPGTASTVPAGQTNQEFDNEHFTNTHQQARGHQVSTSVATVTVPARNLARLSTPELIGQYEWALRDFKGRQTNTSSRQKRINLIVDMISARADDGDVEANAWFEAAK